MYFLETVAPPANWFKIWLKINLQNFVSTGIVVLILLLLLIVMKVITRKIKHKSKNKRSYTVIKLLENIIKYTAFIIAIFVILKIWGVDVSAALAGVGIVGLVVGLGAQDLIRDFLAGLGIIFDNQYEIDDTVCINGFKGRVTEIGLRTTKIVDYTGEIKIIRNGNITEVSNFSRTFSLASVVVEVAYKEDIDKVIALLEENLHTVKENYPQIIEGPVVIGVDDLKTNGVGIRINAKTIPEEHYAVKRGILKTVKELFDKNQIEIPFAQIVVHEEKNE